MRKSILSLSKKDFTVQTFQSGGKGGQHQNKTDSGVRIIHPASGARAESRAHRSQLQNKKAAFKRLTASIDFRRWVMAVTDGGKSLEDKVAEAMMPENILIETKNDGKWEGK